MKLNRRKYYEKDTRINRRHIAILITVMLIILLVIGTLFLNQTRIKLLIKGYDYQSQNIILSLEDEQINEYLSFNQIVDIKSWNEYANAQHYYDYELYKKEHSQLSIEEIIQKVDKSYELYDNTLSSLGYSKATFRELLNEFTLEELEFIAEKNYSYETIKGYIAVEGYIVEDFPKYIQSNKTPLDAVLSISYPAINSQNQIERYYTILNPDNILVLIKKGFAVDASYVPDDLVKVSIPIAPDNEHNMLRKEAADALKEMYDDALKENLHLVLNSGYRSYQQQKEIYDEYFRIYDEVTAGGLVAMPGTSEHQLGLGIDLTSQSVIDGNKFVFGDTDEYVWVVENAYKYGFILRYPSENSNLTGTVNEPWHFRYVGKEAAKEIYDHHWTLEEYILHYGFSYDLLIKE